MGKRWAFVLINLEGEGDFFFDLFPREIQTSDRAVWEPQDITIGVKPLFFANRDPKRISIPEVALDRSDELNSIKPDIDALLKLQVEIPRLGRPPALLAMWGEEQVRCVLETVDVKRTWFSAEGDPQRAAVSLQLLQLQEEREAVDVVVRDVDDDVFNSGSGIGNF